MKCIICKEEIISYPINKYYPFCSLHCKNIDLYNWLDEKYIIEEPLNNEKEVGDKNEY